MTELKRFSLGLRFAMTQDAALTPETVWALLFARVSAELVSGLTVHGAWDDAAKNEPEPAYDCIFSGMSLTRAKKLYRALEADQLLCSYLTAYMPFAQNNWLEKCGTATELGRVSPDGAVEGGECAYASMRFTGEQPEKRAVRAPRILIAAESVEFARPPADVVRRMTRAAVEVFPSAQVTAARLSDGGRGTLDAMVAACCGRYLRVAGSGVRYGVLPDRTVVLETEQLTDEQTSAALSDIMQNGYRAFLLAEGKRRMRLSFPEEISVTVLSDPVPEAPYKSARIAYASGVETALQYGDFLRLCAESDAVVLATEARDERCALLNATADTVRFHCEKIRVPFSILAKRKAGGYLIRPCGQAAEALDASCELDAAARELFTRLGAPGI